MAVLDVVKVDCGGGLEYELHGKSLSGVFAAAAAVTGRSGAALIEAVMEQAPQNVSIILRRENGNLHDGPGDDAAVKVFGEKSGRVTLKEHYRNGRVEDTATEAGSQQFDDETGRLLVRRHYSNGRINDTDAEPAVMMAYQEDHVSFIRYQNGWISDGVNGEPALQRFNKDGMLVYQDRYQNNLLNDGVKGEAGHKIFDDQGRLLSSEHCQEGRVTPTRRDRLHNFIRKFHR